MRLTQHFVFDESLLMCVRFFHLAAAPLPVIIRSDADSVVCVNSTITLTCVATGATDYKWTTSDHVINNNNTDSITVTATPEAIQYTCTATDDDGNTGTATTTVASNGKITMKCDNRILCLYYGYTMYTTLYR